MAWNAVPQQTWLCSTSVYLQPSTPLPQGCSRCASKRLHAATVLQIPVELVVDVSD